MYVHEGGVCGCVRTVLSTGGGAFLTIANNKAHRAYGQTIITSCAPDWDYPSNY